MSDPGKNQGFYRRRRGIYEHLEIGDIDLLDLGLHDWLCGHARALMDSAKYPAGVWIGNAEVIWQMTGKKGFHDVWTIRRRLRKLEQLGYFRRFKIKDTTSAFVINKMIVSDSVRRDFLVNAEETTDWRHPVYEDVSRASGVDKSCVSRASGVDKSCVRLNENVDTGETEEKEENIDNVGDDGSTDETKQVPVHQVAENTGASPATPQSPAEHDHKPTPSPASRPATPATTPTGKQGAVLIDPGVTSRSPRPAGPRSTPGLTPSRPGIDNPEDRCSNALLDVLYEDKTVPLSMLTVAATTWPGKWQHLLRSYGSEAIVAVLRWASTHNGWKDYIARARGDKLDYVIAHFDNIYTQWCDSTTHSTPSTNTYTTTTKPTWQQLAHAYGQDPEFKSCV